jgi:hypothetical protein
MVITSFSMSSVTSFLVTCELPLYVLMHTLICPTYIGAVGRRNRFWGILLHRVEITKYYCHISNFIRPFARICLASFHIIMRATEDDLDEDDLEEDE